MISSKHIALLYNNKAAKGKSLHVAKQIQQRFDQTEIKFQLFDKVWPDELNMFTEVWLVGGDGTLNYFINKYPEIKIPIALFKGGTGNDFAWKLYGNNSVDECIDRAFLENENYVDAGLCNSRYFINGVGIGFDGEVVKGMRIKKYLPVGHIAYLLVVLQKIFTYKEQFMNVEFDEQKIHSKLLMIHIANASRYGGGFMVAPQARIDDGLLDIIMCYPLNVIKRLFNLPKIEKGTHLNLPFMNVSTCKRIVVKSPKKITAHLDGELMTDNKFEINILPKRFVFR